MKKSVITWLILVVVILLVIILAVVYAVNSKNEGKTTTNEEGAQASNTVTAESGEVHVNVMEGETFTIEPENLTSIQ